MNRRQPTPDPHKVLVAPLAVTDTGPFGSGGSQTGVEPSAHAVRDQPCDLNGRQGHRKGAAARVAQPRIPREAADRGGGGEGEGARSKDGRERRRERRGVCARVHPRGRRAAVPG